jgi:hypothetical protein
MAVPPNLPTNHVDSPDGIHGEIISAALINDLARAANVASTQVFNAAAFGFLPTATHLVNNAAIAAALAACAAAGGGTVLVANGEYALSQQVVVPPLVTLRGMGRNTFLSQQAALGAGVACVRLGNGTGRAFNCRLENLSITCNRFAGSIGVYSTDINEQSAISHVVVTQYMVAGILIDATLGPSDDYADDFYIEHCELYASDTAGTGTGLIYRAGLAKAFINDITINVNGPAVAQGPGILITGTDQFHGFASVTNIHAENCTEGVYFSTGARGSAINVEGRNCTNGAVVLNTTGPVAVVAAMRTGSTSYPINDLAKSIAVGGIVASYTTNDASVHTQQLTQHPVANGDSSIVVKSATTPFQMLVLSKTDLSGNLARWFLVQDDALGITRNTLRIQSDCNGVVTFARYDARDAVTIDTSLASVSALGAVQPGNGTVTGGQFWSGSGVPSNAMGANGDAYLRTDTPTTANQRLYVRSAGAWIGIL